jgi:hypothetical protein
MAVWKRNNGVGESRKEKIGGKEGKIGEARFRKSNMRISRF